MTASTDKPVTTYKGKPPDPVPQAQQMLEATKARLLAEAAKNV